MLNLIEEEDDGKWGYTLRRFLSINPVNGNVTMIIPDGIITNPPRIGLRGKRYIPNIRKPIEAPHPIFHTSINTRQHAGYKRPLQFALRYDIV